MTAREHQEQTGLVRVVGRLAREVIRAVEGGLILVGPDKEACEKAAQEFEAARKFFEQAHSDNRAAIAKAAEREATSA